MDAHDVDYQGDVRPSAMIRYIQDAAGHAHHCLGLSLESLRDEYKRAFLLSRTGMRVLASPRVYDSIRAVTWIAPVKGFSVLRFGQIWRGDELMAQSRSVWALTDISDPHARKLVRADTLDLPFGVGEPLDIGFPVHFRIPAELALTEVGQRSVTYADCDANRHMNNTVYPDMFRGYCNIADGRPVSEVEISYVSEAPMGETLTILRGTDGDQYYFRSVLPSGAVNAEARISFVS